MATGGYERLDHQAGGGVLLYGQNVVKYSSKTYSYIYLDNSVFMKNLMSNIQYLYQITKKT